MMLALLSKKDGWQHSDKSQKRKASNMQHQQSCSPSVGCAEPSALQVLLHDASCSAPYTGNKTSSQWPALVGYAWYGKSITSTFPGTHAVAMLSTNAAPSMAGSTASLWLTLSPMRIALASGRLDTAKYLELCHLHTAHRVLTASIQLPWL